MEGDSGICVSSFMVSFYMLSGSPSMNIIVCTSLYDAKELYIFFCVLLFSSQKPDQNSPVNLLSGTVIWVTTIPFIYTSLGKAVLFLVVQICYLFFSSLPCPLNTLSLLLSSHFCSNSPVHYTLSTLYGMYKCIHNTTARYYGWPGIWGKDSNSVNITLHLTTSHKPCCQVKWKDYRVVVFPLSPSHSYHHVFILCIFIHSISR